MMQQDQESNEVVEVKDQEEAAPSRCPQLEQTYLPIIKWSTDKVLEWLNKKLQHHLPSEQSTIARLNKIFAGKRITGEVLLELNNDYLEYMAITEVQLK